jgi:hypothetical protein
MKQKGEKKLVLRKEIVVNLNPKQLETIKGGTFNSACNCWTQDCCHH